MSDTRPRRRLLRGGQKPRGANARLRRDAAGALRHMSGWKRQPYDPRDYQYTAQASTQGATLSLRSRMPAVRDQMNIGSCTSNAGVVATEFCLAKQTGRPSVALSRLDLYASTRELEGTPLSEDSGCYVRNVFKASSKFGICEERLWPYVPSKFDRHPPRATILESIRKRASSYYAVTGLVQIKKCLADGHPMIFGFDCYLSLFDEAVAATGVIPFPTARDIPIGGHCVTCIGYSDSKKALEIQNSWGTGWGDRGFGWLPYDYVTRGLASDFWTVRRETIQ